MPVTFQTIDIPMPDISKKEITQWIKDVSGIYNKKTGEIAYIFCNDEKILEVNREYLQHDYYTDIITFDYTEKDKIAGDIFVSIDTVQSNSEQFKVPFQNELNRVIIHGILHLCGINDKSPEERAVMENAENQALKLLSENKV